MRVTGCFNVEYEYPARPADLLKISNFQTGSKAERNQIKA